MTFDKYLVHQLKSSDGLDVSSETASNDTMSVIVNILFVSAMHNMHVCDST